MRKKSFRLIISIALASIMTVLVPNNVKAYDPNRIVKLDATVTDSSVMSFGSAYDRFIPAGVKMAFESEGGMIYVIPHNVVDSRVNLSGWSGGSLNNVTGYLDPNGGYPAVYLNSKVVDNAKRYSPSTSDKVIVHELGHYVCLEANKIRNGYYSYDFTPENQAIINSEFSGYKNTPGMMAVLKSSFDRNVSSSEFYANVFAAMILDPANAQVAFPGTCAIINADIAQINSKFAPALTQQQTIASNVNQAAIQAQQAQALQMQQAQALQAQQAAYQQQLELMRMQLEALAAQTQDTLVLAQANQQLALIKALQNQK